MDELLNEHEQGERVRSWLQRNAAGIIGGIAVGLALVWGWHWWQGKRESESSAEALAYAQFQEKLAASGPEEIAKARAALPAGSIYDLLAGLSLAKAQVDAGQSEQALATLRGLKTRDAGLAAIIDQRIARLLLDTGKADEALKLLGKSTDPAALEIIGDAEASMGKQAAAAEAYRSALREMEEGSPERQLVEIKLSTVEAAAPASPAPAEAKPAGESPRAG